MLSRAAVAADDCFTTFARRATRNLNEYVQAEIYARLATKAQSIAAERWEHWKTCTIRAGKRCGTYTSMKSDKPSLPSNSITILGLQEMTCQPKQSYAIGVAGECPVVACPRPQGNGLPNRLREK
jgi:hypothetical protein